MDELPIGRRVAYWRSRRKMSQQVFADRLGKSKSWVDKVERGVRRLDKFSVLYEIADILQIDVQLLHGKDPERRTDALNCIDQVEVEEIRTALERYDSMSAYFDAAPFPPPLADMRKAVNHAWLTYQYGRYGMLTRALPKLLRDAQAADAGYAADEQVREAAHLLGQVYQIASSVLRKLGECDLAWLAADRSMAVAQRADDPLLAGIATTRVCNALVAMGRPRPALELNVRIAGRLAPGGDNDVRPERLSVYGMLLLQGAMAAARIGDSATVDDLLAGADEAAKLLGGDHNHYWTSFGPTNLELHRAAAAVELGDGGRAVETHLRLSEPAFNALLPERRAHHLLDLARGYSQIGDVASAGDMLLRGDRLAPSEIRCRPIAHELMSEILRRTRGAPPQPIAELAEHMGVGV
ncbi:MULTISPECIES: helix-turn-helix domain-containing protein [Micromonospora]|uniref:XRE family transcriptional regulator n=1 Tax=Micromonospora chalcea TaxID=1874 RepID=A0ABX9Y052_MICCH|nr:MULTISPECIES: helix-turn-helix domain-containing protein [Micromonospora]MBC8993233.1 helix-turn-helix transcriptional regulator [Micromonospora chalcea]MBQ1063416.1 helix-turn-helix transcriptional regulator [Micromonospora sp. C41]MBQ1069918.1 helix-turn-helix transcriptional regulator [Micromonospora sp. D75]NHO82267.1 helix-turn-helix transcriptional regulator [Micromonospora sp. CMU55-4]ODB77688.1 transcriptional regulator [Micromonospora sp. II]